MNMVAALLALTAAVSMPAGEREPPPNVILILADDLGWGDVGYQGQSYHETPAIDRLARRGMTFSDAYANAPNCAPSRACLMTGQYGPRHGVYTVGNAARGASRDRKLIPLSNRTDLDPILVTLPEVLGSRGYATASIGKWHLGPDPTKHGFAHNIGGTQRGHPRSYFSPYRNPSLPDGDDREYLTDRLTDEAIRFMESHTEEPFFLYLSHYAVHTPIQGRPDLTRHYREKREANRRRFDGRGTGYAAMVASLDESVGRVLDTLDRLNIAERTIVVFFSDNGGHGSHATNAPFRGSKGMFYEGGIRVPMIVSWPNHLPGGVISPEPVIGLDLFPTLMELVGLDAETIVPHPALDGLSLAPLLRGERDTLDRPALFWHFPAYLEGYRRGRAWRATPGGIIRAGRLKLIESFEDGRVELFDLAADPSETHDLAAERPEDAARLLALLRQWREDTGAGVPTELNPDYQAPEPPN